MLFKNKIVGMGTLFAFGLKGVGDKFNIEL